jgi:XTP/dITP diphosphohydrolase
VKGQIAYEKTGHEGFGYDPIFIPEGETRSFAEMSMSEKNAFSHRARAMAKLVAFFNTHPNR